MVRRVENTSEVVPAFVNDACTLHPVFWVLGSAVSFLALAAASADESSPHTFEFAAVPTATFNTDEGFGTGGVGTLYHHHEDVKPYRDALTLNVFISSKLVQHHALTWDALKPFGLLGRSYLRFGSYSTLSQNYCGVGNEVTCAPGDATAAARAAGLVDDPANSDDAWDAFVRRYHLMRFLRPYATVIFRPWLRDKPYRTELLLGWRGAMTIPGDLEERGPWKGSLFARDRPDGEPGFSSVPFAGVIVDNRDAEIFPMAGTYFETSVRGAGAATGATWTWGGLNAALAGYFGMSREPRIAVAARAIVDVMVGEPSLEEMARIGGTLDSIAFGGSQIGRGIREHRYVGKVKGLAQAELRAQLAKTEVFGEVFDHGAALFSDVGYIAYDLVDVRGHATKLLTTAGISYRVLWNESFAIRWDLALSPNEAEGPGFYIIVGQVF